MNDFVIEASCQEQIKEAVKSYRFSNTGKKVRVANMNSYKGRKQIKMGALSEDGTVMTIENDETRRFLEYHGIDGTSQPLSSRQALVNHYVNRGRR